MKINYINILALILISTIANSQDFKNYFIPPLDGVLLSSGNFAETRSNHFHSGVDIKTGGVEGKPLRAAAAGYISRINIAPRGFGKTIYIAHPNGLTTVYAHMKSFTPAVEKYVRDERYRLQKHAIDLFPDAKKFPVTQGELIGYSGNTGSSGGPHLHYEVRDSSQRPMNPVTIGALKLADNIAPTIVRLHYVALDSAGIVPVAMPARAIEVVRQTGNSYTVAAPVEVGPNGYFIVEATDRKNNTQNTMGVYRAVLKVDDKTLLEWSLDKFAFADTRYVNSFCYYPKQRGARNQFLRLARQAGNKLPVYKGTNGAIVLHDDLSHTAEITVEDDTKNVATLRFTIRRKEQGGMPVPEGTPVDHSRTFVQKIGDINVIIPAGALYDNVFLDTKEISTTGIKGDLYSKAYSVGSPDVPLHKAMTLSIEADSVPAPLRPKACLGLVTADGKGVTYAGGRWEGGRVTGNASIFGRFLVTTDTVAPTITTNFTEGADLSGRSSVSFTLRDNFSGIGSFEANIDGQWIIFEQQGNVITHHFDPQKTAYKGTTHILRLTVRDNKGNTATLSRGFKR